MVVRFGVGTVISRQDNDIGYDLRLDAMDSTGNLYVTGIFDGDIPDEAPGRCTHGPKFRTLWDDQPTIEWWVNPQRREGILGKIARFGKRVSGVIVRFRGW